MSLTDPSCNNLKSETILSYFASPLSKKQVKLLTHGLIPWKGRLDLHGLTVSDARFELCKFIDDQLKKKHRCVLIIHGKGRNVENNAVLKNHVNHWLRQFSEVLAFHSAIAKHGGQGAIYVILRKQY